jgi:hypothetical protein
LRLTRPDGGTEELELLADTGNPCALVCSQAVMARLKQRSAPDVHTNFGSLEGGWIRLNMPELGLDQEIVGYASDMVVNAAKASSSDFDGLAGLPLLRLTEYGGNADWFWIRRIPK